MFVTFCHAVHGCTFYYFFNYPLGKEREVVALIFTTFTIFCTDYLGKCKVYINVGGIKFLWHGLYTCTLDNPLAKARGFSPRPDRQTMV